MTQKREHEREHDAPDAAVATQPAAAKPKADPLPPYKVLLHNDDFNTMEYAVATVHQLTPLKLEDAKQRAFEAHHRGLSLLLKTHKERAELYQEQFQSKGMTVTIEPDEK